MQTGHRVAAATLIAVNLAPIVTASPASASSSGCDGSNSPATSCASVVGAGTYVDSVAGGVNLSTNHSATGYFEIGSAQAGLDFKTPIQSYYNASRWHNSISWGPSQRVGRQLPTGSVICAWFWEQQNGSYVRHRPACETVHA